MVACYREKRTAVIAAIFSAPSPAIRSFADAFTLSLFGFFSAAFAMLAIDWLVHAAVSPRHESQHYLFVIRLAAFF